MLFKVAHEMFILCLFCRDTRRKCLAAEVCHAVPRSPQVYLRCTFGTMVNDQHFEDFNHGGVQLNENDRTLPHKDDANIGESVLIVCGDCVGGGTAVNEDNVIRRHDGRQQPMRFDGSKHVHWAKNFNAWHRVVAQRQVQRWRSPASARALPPSLLEGALLGRARTQCHLSDVRAAVHPPQELNWRPWSSILGALHHTVFCTTLPPTRQRCFSPDTRIFQVGEQPASSAEQPT